MKILGIDPGTKRLGWALFSDGKLIDCGTAHTKNKDLAQGAFEMALDMPHSVDVVVIEKMRIYRPKPGQNVKKLPNPEDLVNITMVSGIIAGCITAKDERYLFPYANEWGQSLPKDQKNAIMGALVPNANKIMDKKKIANSYRNHTLDACGIGLWAINKTNLERKRK